MAVTASLGRRQHAMIFIIIIIIIMIATDGSLRVCDGIIIVNTFAEIIAIA